MVKTSTPVPIRSLRLTREQLTRLLERIAMRGAGVAAARTHKRVYERRSALGAAMLLTINMPGQPACFAVPLRDISQGGLAFLHRSMVHRATKVWMRIRLANGKWLVTGGAVAWCRHVEGIVHEIGVRFDGLVSEQDIA